MKTFGNYLRCLPFLICITFLILSPAYAAMNDYCIAPPFIVSGVTPNLLLMMDNSASMFDLAYQAGTFSAPPVYTCSGGISTATSYCYDNTYINSKIYEGYFDPAMKYRYNERPANNSMSPEANDTFAEVPSILSPCPGTGSSFACVVISGTGTTADPYRLSDFFATGNFLNWLSASKFDIQKKVFTGGKYDTTNSLLIGESRGCNGRRFVKIDSNLPGVTFALRGPNSFEPDYVNPDTQGGLSRIEIYKGVNPNMDDCQCAIANWTLPGGSDGQARVDTANCLSTGSAEIQAYNQVIGDCLKIGKNIKEGSALFNGVDINSTTVQCLGVYNSLCGGENVGECNKKPGTNPTTNPGFLTGAIINENSGIWQCTSVATHLTPGAPYNSYDTPDPVPGLGYIGKCVTSFAWSGQKLTANWDNDCVRREILHFCYGADVSEVIDPSEGATNTATGNLPSILMDSSVRSLGTSAGTLYVRVSKNPPTGLLQEFSNRIRFGAMSFNCIGSASETLPGTCKTGANLDAGRILPDAYIGDPMGDHSLGIIKAVDDLVGMSWTPYAEAFYNAIGYFARTNGYDVIPGLSRTALRVNADDFVENKNPSQYRCQTNNVLIITDGMSTADHLTSVNNLAVLYSQGGETGWTATSPENAGSRNLDDLAWLARNRNIKTFNTSSASTDTSQELSERITTHVVFTGVPCRSYDASGNCITTDESVPEKLMQLTAQKGGGTYQRVEDPAKLYDALRRQLIEISGKAASGTAASVLASGEGSGANLVQAIFYPSRDFAGTEIAWTGSLKNLWYHLDPFLGRSTIREDTNSDQTLNLTDDHIISFFFDPVPKLTFADLKIDSNGDGVGESADPRSPVYFEEVKSLWEAGGKLWARDSGTRNIYTTTDGSTLTDFNAGNAGTLRPKLMEISDPRASRLISYIRGHDKFCSATVNQTCNINADCPAGETCVIPLRNRTVANVDLNSDGDTTDTVGGVSEASARVWKLGDIVNSTPRIASWVPLNTYHKSYLDLSYKRFVEDKDNSNKDIASPLYKNRGMVFVGANDGMLHALRLGKLELFEEKYKKATLSGTDIGREEWAFIPQNVLPYLQYFADPGYCHIYSVDLTTYIFDASICKKGSCSGAYWDAAKDRDSWRTIVIGGMRLGGACKDAASAYGVQNPTPGLGYSSYFALDVTETLADPTKPPELLWEFYHPDLGFSTSGPAIVRISAKKLTGLPDHYKNGRWFVVFGSGPTGPIEAIQFKGFSDQNLKVFILDLKTGALEKTIDTGIPYAFSGSMMNAAIDFDQDNSTLQGFYSDDAVYFGYSQAEGALATSYWTKGGVLRLFTKNSLYPDGSATELPWEFSDVINNIGPVTASVAKLQNYKDNTVRLYFGTGRYFYKIVDQIDDQASGRRLYGLIEPCYSGTGVNFGCTSTASAPVVAATAAGVGIGDNWYISLDMCTNAAGTTVLCTDPAALYKTERNVTDPLATSIGAVFFTTTKPAADPCTYGGASHLWGVKYDTGGKISSSVLRGKALLQVSTGRIAEVDLGTAFKEREGRRTEAIIGVPPAGAPPGILVPPKPINKIIHIREK